MDCQQRVEHCRLGGFVDLRAQGGQGVEGVEVGEEGKLAHDGLRSRVVGAYYNPVIGAESTPRRQGSIPQHQSLARPGDRDVEALERLWPVAVEQDV